MSRKIKDIKDKHTGELVYPRTHISAVVLTSDSTLEDIVEAKQDKIDDLDEIRAGAAKGATALQSYTEKYTGTVTGIKINGETKSGSGVIDLGTISTDISGKVDKVAGKQLSTEDFTTALKNKLEGLNNYDDTELSNAVETLRGDFDEIVSGDTTTAIKTFNEVIAFLDGLTDTQDLESIIASIEQQIAGKMDTLISGTNIKTINGESILGSGDLTIDSGAKVYEWAPEYTFGEDENIFSGTITQDVYNNLLNADLIFATIEGIKFPCFSQSDDTSILATGIITMFGDTVSLQIAVINNELTFVGKIKDISPTKTSQLENDSNFVTSDGLKTINGQTLLGDGDITVGGEDNVQSDWNVTNSSSDAYIKNKPIIPTNVSQLNNDRGLVDEQFARENFIGRSEDLSGMEVARIDQFLTPYGSLLYAFPDTANGDEDDVLLSRNTVKTINGESIVGSGNITISGGSGEDIRYFTEFTVEDFIEACESNNVITYDTTELFNAMKSNKVICVPYEGFDKGFIVASYKYKEYNESSTITLRLEYNGNIYEIIEGDNNTLIANYPVSLSGSVVTLAVDEHPQIEVKDNTFYNLSVEGEFINMQLGVLDVLSRGCTIRFFSSHWVSAQGNVLPMTLDIFGAEVLWPNGVVPEIEIDTWYELSLTTSGDMSYCLAVLTPFKQVE